MINTFQLCFFRGANYQRNVTLCVWFGVIVSKLDFNFALCNSNFEEQNMVIFENGERKDLLKNFNEDSQYVCLFSLDEFVKAEFRSDIKEKMLYEFAKKNNLNSKFEHFKDYDLIFFNVPDQLERENNVDAISFCISKNLIYIVYVPWGKGNKFEDIVVRNANNCGNAGDNLVYLLDIFTKEDMRTLQNIEAKVTDLEDQLMTSYDDEYIKNIIFLRKELLALKNYYEEMIDIFDELNENENSFLSDDELRHSKNIENRVNRLYRTVLNLRDYVTQVREAYQSQADIKLNDVMKIFTVITSIFLPLTLIVGWYGMNFKSMPELGWKYSYPLVGVLSVVVVGICIAIFKRKKWF